MGKAGERIIRLLVIDDHALFRESVARLLQAEPGFEVVAHCGTSAEALRVLKSSEEIDVVLLDLDLGNEKGAEFLGLLKKTGFGGKVLLVTAGVNEAELPSLIRKGISGVFFETRLTCIPHTGGSKKLSRGKRFSIKRCFAGHLNSMMRRRAKLGVPS